MNTPVKNGREIVKKKILPDVKKRKPTNLNKQTQRARHADEYTFIQEKKELKYAEKKTRWLKIKTE